MCCKGRKENRISTIRMKSKNGTHEIFFFWVGGEGVPLVFNRSNKIIKVTFTNCIAMFHRLLGQK